MTRSPCSCWAVSLTSTPGAQCVLQAVAATGLRLGPAATLCSTTAALVLLKW
jgi:hypothetical protein